MKNIFTLFALILFSFQLQGQLFYQELIRTFTIPEIEQLRDDMELPEGLLPINYEVDVYKILYNTPYKHLDSLVQASGAIFVPKNTECPVPLGSYGHGTQSIRSNVASNLNGGQWEVSLFFAAAYGYMITNPDYLGLGDSDPAVKIHPYTHAFSQSHTTVNMLRSARQLAESIDIEMNGQIFLYGYSHGGFTTVATHRLIEEEFPEEFHIAASAPMSGPYDLIDAQVDLIISTEPYATPGYLPYIVLAYKEMFPDLLEDFIIDEVFVPPYNTLLPDLFYSGDYSIGYINGQCTPVPRDMISPQVMSEFENDPNHPLRQALAESHMLDWAPQAPIKLFYCNGDEQVTYLNSELAYDAWTNNGAPNVEKVDLGDLTHGECAEFAFIQALFFFEDHKTCWGTLNNHNISKEEIEVFPNPTKGWIEFKGIEDRSEIRVVNAIGKEIFNGTTDLRKLDVSSWNNGFYFFEIEDTLSDKILIGKFSILK